MKNKDFTIDDTQRYHQLIDEFHKTMSFSEALIKAQKTIAQTLKFRRKNK